MLVLPESFASSVLAPANLGGVIRLNDETEPDGGHMLSMMLAKGAALARALEDGRLDHTERADLAPRFERLGVECIGFGRGLRANPHG
jgi:hypothetical protein